MSDWQVLQKKVLEGTLDLAVAELTSIQEHPQLQHEALPHHPGVFICRRDHPLTRLETVSLRDTEAYPLVASSLARRLGPLKPTIRVDTYGLVRDVVLASNTLGLSAACQSAEELAQGLIASLPLQVPWLHTGYGFIWLKGRTLSPAAVVFMRIMKQVEEELVASGADFTGTDG